MGAETGIAWTDHTFNPWWGCQRVSPGCEHCYAEAWDRRWDGKHWGAKSERRMFGDAHWNEPRKWNRDAEKAGMRARVFCASMADVFEDRRDLDDSRNRLFELIGETPHLDWQLLTKRPENMIGLTMAWWPREWPRNVWAGCTTEDQKRFDERVPHLCKVPAAVRFVSVEPQLERIEPRPWLHWPSPIHWVIVGGESGAGARSFHTEWARLLIKRASEAGAAVFVKQLGARPIEIGGVRLRFKDAKGGKPSEWAADLRVRSFPDSARTPQEQPSPRSEPAK